MKSFPDIPPEKEAKRGISFSSRRSTPARLARPGPGAGPLSRSEADPAIRAEAGPALRSEAGPALRPEAGPQRRSASAAIAALAANPASSRNQPNKGPEREGTAGNSPPQASPAPQPSSGGTLNPIHQVPSRRIRPTVGP
ncbi:hypothetical protein T484DRAFT_3496432 [Baffinella frigidus]|nr:hypothetical protein T484DRAFT_3496432 [Cryptophyta sp. CCMP2293]